MFHEIEVKTILNKKKRRDPWFLDEYTLNPYSACSFNCLYCYIRGSRYGINMEEKLSVKRNAPELLEKQLSLRAGKNQFGFIVLSSSTDPYLQAEEKYGLTRRLLEIILKYRFPLHVITKSALVTRDFDLLKRINEAAILPPDLSQKISAGCIITFSFSTVDDTIAGIFEPGATLPSERLKILKQSVDYGFKTGVSTMPVIPFISDTQESLGQMFDSFKEAGAHYVLPASMTLFGNEAHDSRTLMFNAIKKYFPQLENDFSALFNNDDGTSEEYQKAFYKKIKGLQDKCQLRSSIAG